MKTRQGIPIDPGKAYCYVGRLFMGVAFCLYRKKCDFIVVWYSLKGFTMFIMAVETRSMFKGMNLHKKKESVPGQECWSVVSSLYRGFVKLA